MTQTILASLARIADFERNPYDVRALDKREWAAGDYVLAEVCGTRSVLYAVETSDGTMVPVQPGDQVIGVFGHREGTLEGVGSYVDVEKGQLHALTSAGLLGAFTSFSILLPKPMSLKYRGNLIRDGRKVTMSQFAIRSDSYDYNVPTIVIIGTSMSAGKTVTGRRACEILSTAGLTVFGTKLTGAGRYRDIGSFKKSGAAKVYDFVDAGLPSSLVPEAEFRAAIRPLLGHISAAHPDVVVVEAGASPLEPYNVGAAMDELGDNICCMILAASDPFAVVGVIKAFGVQPDLVTGLATSTSAAIRLVKELSGLPALNVINRETMPAFREFLGQKLGLTFTATGPVRQDPADAGKVRQRYQHN
jgi:hypothetical protein